MVESAHLRDVPPPPPADLWAEVLRRLLGEDSRSIPATLAAAEPVSFDGSRLVLQVPSAFHRERLSARHLARIQEALQEQGRASEVEIVVAARESVAGQESATAATDQLSLQLDEPEASSMSPPGDPLDPRLTFDAFIVGKSNRLAQAAALSVAENSAEAYSPLFIHGDSGNGKTHLLHAIGLHVREHSPRVRVRYVTVERFTREFIEGIRANRLDAFKRRYRACSLLLVDDVHFLERKEATQEEFFHTFNEVATGGGRVVLTSDCHPGDIPTLPDRLRSRFRSGLIADLQAPEFETRLAILRKKAGAKSVVVPDDVLAAVASAVTRNVRELEGALIRVLADARLAQRDVTLEGAQRSLEGFLGRGSRVLTLARITDEAAELFGVSTDDLRGPSRARQVVAARQAAMYVARSLTEESLPSIGRSFGGRDHTTVLHAVRKIEKLMPESPSVHAKVVELMNRLGGAPPDV